MFARVGRARSEPGNLRQLSPGDGRRDSDDVCGGPGGSRTHLAELHGFPKPSLLTLADHCLFHREPKKSTSSKRPRRSSWGQEGQPEYLMQERSIEPERVNRCGFFLQLHWSEGRREMQLLCASFGAESHVQTSAFLTLSDT